MSNIASNTADDNQTDGQTAISPLPGELAEPIETQERLKLNILRHEDDFDASSHWPFSNPLPRLRNLHLKIYRSVEGVLRAPNLRVLHIYRNNSAGYGYDPWDLFDTMRQMPLLEDVLLHFALPFFLNSDHIETYSISPLHLPNLKSLELNDRAPVLPYLLGHVTIPIEASLAVGCDVWDPEDTVKVAAALRQQLIVVSPEGLTQQRRIRSLSVKNTLASYDALERCLQFEGCEHVHGSLCAEGHVCDNPRIKLGLAYVFESDHKWTKLDGFMDIFQLLHLSDLEVLNIKGRDVYDIFREHFPDTFALHDVALAGAPTSGVHHFMLSPFVDVEGTPTLRRTLCVDLSPEEHSMTLAGDIENARRSHSEETSESGSESGMEVDDV